MELGAEARGVVAHQSHLAGHVFPLSRTVPDAEWGLLSNGSNLGCPDQKSEGAGLQALSRCRSHATYDPVVRPIQGKLPLSAGYLRRRDAPTVGQAR